MNNMVQTMEKFQKYLGRAIVAIIAILIYLSSSDLQNYVLKILNIDPQEMSNAAKLIFLIIWNVVLMAILLLLYHKSYEKDIKDIRKNHKKYYKEYFKYWLIAFHSRFIFFKPYLCLFFRCYFCSYRRGIDF